MFAAVKQVVPAEYPELLPLCSLDALCLSTLSRAVMQHFDSGGVLDTSLSLDPLKELLSHHLVEMGPAPVRVQAALEVAVYASIMTPLATRGTQRQCLLSVVPSSSNLVHACICKHVCGCESKLFEWQMVLVSALSGWFRASDQNLQLQLSAGGPARSLCMVRIWAWKFLSRCIQQCLAHVPEVCCRPSGCCCLFGAAEPAESDTHYRNLMYMLLAVGQRTLALLVARTR